MSQPACAGLKMKITGEGACWEQGALTLVVPKDASAPGWIYLSNLVRKPSFQNSNCFQYSRKVPSELTDYIVETDRRQGRSVIIRDSVPRRARGHERIAWPVWDVPADQLVKKMLMEITPFIRMIDPRVVDAIVRHNAEIQPFIESMRADGIRTEAYVWDGSPCLFPGIRRAVGGTDADLKKKIVPRHLRADKQAIYIDDNSYAKHLWAFLLTNRNFANQGPVGYELAHLFHHKSDSDTDTSDEIDGIENREDPISGFFTAATSCAFIPKSLARVTDLNLSARRLIQRRVYELYQGACNPLPPGCSLKSDPADWHTSEFEWAPAVGYSESGTALNALLKFRFDELQRLVENSNANAA